VIIRYLNIVRIAVTPSEAYAPLVINPNTVLTGSISLELLKSVPWRDAQVLQSLGSVQYQEFPKGCTVKSGWQSADALAFEQPFRITIPEALDHGVNITSIVNNGKR